MMINLIKDILKKQPVKVFHPECAGTYMIVKRNLIDKLIQNKDFASLNECIKYGGGRGQ